MYRGISVQEATATLQAWYADRPEVLHWQENTKKMAREQGYVRTMMGRYIIYVCIVHYICKL